MVDKPNAAGFTPLHLAAMLCRHSCMSVLLDAGLTPNRTFFPPCPLSPPHPPLHTLGSSNWSQVLMSTSLLLTAPRFSTTCVERPLASTRISTTDCQLSHVRRSWQWHASSSSPAQRSSLIAMFALFVLSLSMMVPLNYYSYNLSCQFSPQPSYPSGRLSHFLCPS